MSLVQGSFRKHSLKGDADQFRKIIGRIWAFTSLARRSSSQAGRPYVATKQRFPPVQSKESLNSFSTAPPEMLMTPNRASEGMVTPQKWMGLLLGKKKLPFCHLYVIHIALELTEKFHLLSERQLTGNMRIKTTGNKETKLCRCHLLLPLVSADSLLRPSEPSIFSSGS